MLTGSFRAAAVTIDAHTVAAPPISALIASIEGDGFREIPPLPANKESGQVVKQTTLCENCLTMRCDCDEGVSWSVCYYSLPVKSDSLAH